MSIRDDLKPSFSSTSNQVQLHNQQPRRGALRAPLNPAITSRSLNPCLPLVIVSSIPIARFEEVCAPAEVHCVTHPSTLHPIFPSAQIEEWVQDSAHGASNPLAPTSSGVGASCSKLRRLMHISLALGGVQGIAFVTCCVCRLTHYSAGNYP